MHRILTGIGLAAAVVLIGASATMNYLFAISLGKTWLDGQVLGAVAVAADVLKAIVIVLVAAAARDGRRTFVVIGTLAFLLFSLASLVAASGFASQNRGAVTDRRGAERAELTRAELDLASTERKLARLPAHRARSVVDAALASYEVDPRWRAAAACRQTVTPSLRDFCRQVADVRQELAASAEADRLEAEMARYSARVDMLVGRGANRAADPQARLLAEAFGLDESTVQRLLMALLSLVVEVASGLGIYLSTGHSRPAAVASASSAELREPHPVSCATEQTQADVPVVPVQPVSASASTVVMTSVKAPRTRRMHASIGIVGLKAPE
jgi:hypothetical protein